MKYPLCADKAHEPDVTGTVFGGPRKMSHCFYEAKSLVNGRKLIPLCRDCAERLRDRHGLQTSPWTSAFLQEYRVQEVMES